MLLISKSKFFKDNKIVRARGAISICILCKINQCSITPNCTRNHVVTFNNVYEKRNTESQTDEILAVRALFVI